MACCDSVELLVELLRCVVSSCLIHKSWVSLEERVTILLVLLSSSQLRRNLILARTRPCFLRMLNHNRSSNSAQLTLVQSTSRNHLNYLLLLACSVLVAHSQIDLTLLTDIAVESDVYFLESLVALPALELVESFVGLGNQSKICVVVLV